MFPAAFPVPTTPNVVATNIAYHGWNVQIKNLFFATATRKRLLAKFLPSIKLTVVSKVTPGAKRHYLPTD